MTDTATQPATKRVRCAIYTRKSTSEGLGQDFNTLDAQRESAEFTIKGMAGEGWQALPTHYDDGGFTGANIERPAMQRLLADIEAGLVDCVVVYKVDRLSRSLTDFAKLLALFDEKGVTFVSTTQNFNTTNSMGRLTLNILLSFAQFEREMIAERTRDKMGAARRRGKWLGSAPPFGYDGDREHMKLVVNEDEAERLRTVFKLYLRHRATRRVADELNERGWARKAHVTKNTGKTRGGGPWDEKAVLKVLRDQVYLGKVRYDGELYKGEHEALVDEDVFMRVQAILASKSCGRGKRRSRNPEYLISGLVHCGRCGGRFTTTAGKGRNGTMYRYYVCKNRRADGCDHPRLSGPELEAVVVEQLRELCADRGLRERIVAKMKDQEVGSTTALYAEQAELELQLAEFDQENERLLQTLRSTKGRGSTLLLQRAGELDDEREKLHTRLAIVHGRLEAIADAREQVLSAMGILTAFEQAWDAMDVNERQELVTLLVEKVVVDEPAGLLEVHFHELDDALMDVAA